MFITVLEFGLHCVCRMPHSLSEIFVEKFDLLCECTGDIVRLDIQSTWDPCLPRRTAMIEPINDLLLSFVTQLAQLNKTLPLTPFLV